MAFSNTEGADLEVLQHLNLAYVAAVQAGDVARFEEILAEEFCCSNPGAAHDGSDYLVSLSNELPEKAPRSAT